MLLGFSESQILAAAECFLVATEETGLGLVWLFERKLWGVEYAGLLCSYGDFR